MSQENQTTRQEENNYTQLCVWQGTILVEENVTAPPADKIKEFEQFFLDELNTRIKYTETVLTNPDKDEFGDNIEGTGGRSDILFFVHNDDVVKFATARLAHGIRWWEDVVKYNEQSYLYSEEILSKYPVTW